ncbi:hypothetical protein RIF29_03886 [Crotalaria pallida]|uniref:Uncharacterized protein n=1 Tax=Crotalaria pallida TaxID=3830 RepID=A0AAN9P8Z8_CROPI
MTDDNAKDSQPQTSETELQPEAVKGLNPDFPKLTDVEKVKEGIIPAKKVLLKELHPAVSAKEKESESGQSSKQKEKTKPENQNKEVVILL